jgi:hypothetical protein
MREVRAALEPEEPDYSGAAELGSNALPHLATLVDSQDPVLGPRAVYLAARIGGDAANNIVLHAAASHDTLFRVAAAGAARTLATPGRNAALARLLTDPDRGVRRVALTSVGSEASPDVVQRLDDVARTDNDPELRRLAEEVRKRIKH